MNSVLAAGASSGLGEYPVFSPRQLDELTLGDAQLQRQLIESFLRQSRKTREDLVGAAEAGEQQFADAMHRLKGSCYFTAADRMLHLLELVSDERGMKSPQSRVAAAQALVSGLEELEGILSGVLSPSVDG